MITDLHLFKTREISINIKNICEHSAEDQTAYKNTVTLNATKLTIMIIMCLQI